MKIIVQAVAGSHLFGTNTEKSDKDFKGVFIPSGHDILIGNYDDTKVIKTNLTNTRNTSEDTDIELYSLRKFLKMCENGDTAALELLFTPEQFIIQKTPEWDEILAMRDKLLCKSVKAIIGYSRQQAAKYGAKGSRLGELSQLNDYLKELSKTQNTNKIKNIFEDIQTFCKNKNHIVVIKMQNPAKGVEEIDGISILGSKFDHHVTVGSLSKWCSDKFKEYGQRAREAKNNNGIDWKALSHALRVCIQAKELLSTGHITLPHSGDNLKLLMDVKQGNYNFDLIDGLLDSELTQVEELSKSSFLPEKIDPTVTRYTLLWFHKKSVDKLNDL